MPKRLAFLMAGALALLLGACNTTQAPGGSGEAKSKVTVSVAFPNQSASEQGLPGALHRLSLRSTTIKTRS